MRNRRPRCGSYGIFVNHLKLWADGRACGVLTKQRRSSPRYGIILMTFHPLGSYATFMDDPRVLFDMSAIEMYIALRDKLWKYRLVAVKLLTLFYEDFMRPLMNGLE